MFIEKAEMITMRVYLILNSLSQRRKDAEVYRQFVNQIPLPAFLCYNIKIRKSIVETRN